MARVASFAFTPHYLATTRLHADTKTLGQSVPFHAEIMRMISRHYGHVPPSWVYGYAHALLGPRDRGKPWVEAGFVVGLIGISFVEFLRYNRRIPRAEWARWGTWLRHGWRQLRERATMRIALDLSLVPGQRVGVGQYAYQLARALAARGPCELLRPLPGVLLHRQSGVSPGQAAGGAQHARRPSPPAAPSRPVPLAAGAIGGVQGVPARPRRRRPQHHVLRAAVPGAAPPAGGDHPRLHVRHAPRVPHPGQHRPLPARDAARHRAGRHAHRGVGVHAPGSHRADGRAGRPDRRHPGGGRSRPGAGDGRGAP